MATLAWIKKENVKITDLIDCGYCPTYKSAIYNFFKISKSTPKKNYIIVVDRGYEPLKKFLIESDGFSEGEIKFSEAPKEECIDGGTCHHDCKNKCFREKCCVPLSHSGLHDNWKQIVFNKVFQDKKMIKEFENYLKSCNVDENLFEKDDFEGKKYYNDAYIHNAFIIFSESKYLKPEERTLVNFVDSEPPCVNDFDKKCLLNGEFDKIDDWPMSLFAIFSRNDEKVKELWSCR